MGWSFFDSDGNKKIKLDSSVMVGAGVFNAKGDLVTGLAPHSFGVLPAGANNTILRADSGETNGLEWASLLGTTNQVIITNNENDVTISLPQDIAASSTPTFGGLTLTGSLNLGGNKATNAGDPTVSTDLATKNYVDSVVANVEERFYLLDSASGVGSYKDLAIIDPELSQESVTASSLGDGDTLIQGWISASDESPVKLLEGIYELHVHAEKTSGTKTVRLYYEIVEYKTDTSEVVIATSGTSDELPLTETHFDLHANLADDYIPDSGSRIVGKIYAQVSGGGSAPSVAIYYLGDTASAWKVPTSPEILTHLFVPYDGAVKDVDLGANNLLTSGEIKIGTVEFPIRETSFGYSTTYKVLQLGYNDTGQRSLALNFDPSGNAGSHFTGHGNILIPKDRSILAPDNAGTDWAGVLRYTNDMLYLGGGLVSGELAGTGIRVTATGNVGVGVNPSEKLHVAGAIYDVGKTVEVTNKNKSQVYLVDSTGNVLLYQNYRWNGSNWVATSSYGLGGLTLQENSGANCNAFGRASLAYNTGGNSNGFGYNTAKNNTGSNCNGLGSYALLNNTGDICEAVGYSALQNNTGMRSLGIGFQTLLYNQDSYNIAIGYNTWASFLDDTSGNKTFDYTDINPGTDRITVTAHGFGSTGGYVNVKYTEGTSPITGLTDGNIYQVKIIDANTIGFNEKAGGTNITAAGTGTGHTLTPQHSYTNSIVIGHNVDPSASNQVTLGNDSITETLLKGKVGIGATNPTYNLDIYDSNPAIALRAPTDTSALCRIVFRTPYSGTDYVGAISSSYVIRPGMTFIAPRDYLGWGFRFDSFGGTSRMFIDSSNGNVGIGTVDPTAALDINSDVLRLRTSKTPSSASATGNQGDICWDSNYVYICVATNTWKRAALGTW